MRQKAVEQHAKAAAAPPSSASLRVAGEGGEVRGVRGEGGASCPRDCSLGLAIIVLTFVGVPMAASS